MGISQRSPADMSRPDRQDGPQIYAPPPLFPHLRAALKWVVLPGLVVAAAFWLLDGPEPADRDRRTPESQARHQAQVVQKPKLQSHDIPTARPSPAAPPASTAGGTWPAFIPASAGPALESARQRADAQGLGQTLPWTSRDLGGFITLVNQDVRCRRYRVTTNNGQSLVNLGFAEFCGR